MKTVRNSGTKADMNKDICLSLFLKKIIPTMRLTTPFFHCTVSLFSIIAVTPAAYAQDDLSYLKKIFEEDRSTVDALILYPEDVRSAMFEASLHPEGLVRLEALQNEYNKSFADLMGQYPKDEQEKYWNIVRYNGLVQKLVHGKRKSENEIQEILKNYPQEIHKTALDLGRNKHDELVNISKMEDAFHAQFSGIINAYPPKTRDAFSKLLEVPEVLSILQENISLVVLVGEAYRKNPELVKQKTDSVSLEVARQNAENVKEWSKTLEENPEAAAELKSAAKDYAKEYGYDDEQYSQPKQKEVVEIHHYYEPYPYWFGYPWWYPRHWWYPYPYWYHWGFYFSDGGIVVIGLPSYYFVSWYFHYPIHHYYYPHLSDAYIYTYRKKPGTRTSNTITRGVNEWVNEKKDRMPEGLLNDDPKRPQRLKEYGKFEEDYARHNLEKPTKPLSRAEYFDKNEKKYPTLNYPKREEQKVERKVYDDVYQRPQYPTKKEIENKTYERKWDYPQQQEPVRKYYPDKKAEPQQRVEPQRKIYPQNNPPAQKKFIPQKETVPQKQIVPKKEAVPQRQLPQKTQPAEKISKPKTGGR